MAMLLFVRQNGSVSGPFTSTQLRSLAGEGKLEPQDEVSTDQQKWIKASRVLGLEFRAFAEVKAEQTANLNCSVPPPPPPPPAEDGLYKCPECSEVFSVSGPILASDVFACPYCDEDVRVSVQAASASGERPESGTAGFRASASAFKSQPTSAPENNQVRPGPGFESKPLPPPPLHKTPNGPRPQNGPAQAGTSNLGPIAAIVGGFGALVAVANKIGCSKAAFVAVQGGRLAASKNENTRSTGIWIIVAVMVVCVVVWAIRQLTEQAKNPIVQPPNLHPEPNPQPVVTPFSVNVSNGPPAPPIKPEIVPSSDGHETWWLLFGGRSTGPYTTAAIAEGVHSGDFPVDSLVCLTTGQQWALVSSFPHFFRFANNAASSPPIKTVSLFDD